MQIVTDINIGGQYPDWVLVVTKKTIEVNPFTKGIVEVPDSAVEEEIDLGP